jgi:trehalose/maltose hydrolase-like predicted phosphorylase
LDRVSVFCFSSDDSARFGNCTGVGPCYDYEYHINNDIALAQWQYYEATGNVTWLREYGYPVLSAVADMWVSNVYRVDSNTSDAYTYQTFNLTDPDEFANNENNGAYTNAGIKVIMAAALSAAQILDVPVNASWVDVGDNIDVPVDPTSGIILEYTGFNGTTPVKQADVVLLTYPLEYPQSEPLENLDYYAIHTSPNGPAMTYSNFAIDSAALSTQGCATWSYLLAGSAPYVSSFNPVFLIRSYVFHITNFQKRQ